MKAIVTHKCNHSRELEVKGVKEARAYAKWLKTLDCPTCEANKKS